MMSLGANLVGDDRVHLNKNGNQIEVSVEPQTQGLIEARGLGLISCDHTKSAALSVVVDMDRAELHRLPPFRTHEILTLDVHLVYGRENWFLASSLIALLNGELFRPEPI